MSRQNKIDLELLAPARNLEIGKIAITHGADAVYIGPSEFGARSAAGNSLQDIAQLAAFAQQFKAKVYATLNTLLFDREVEQAYQLAWDLYRAGVDALIVQDMALCDLTRLPPIELHASTQTHNYSLEKIQFLESIGFDRVILARECSAQQIQNIRQHSTIPLEAFVHGALCVSMSGQCYMSAALNGRSANRGECAQACRYSYDLLNEKGDVVIQNKHLLSLKDNAQIEHLPALIEAGVSSFKIEGRLKDADYVKNVVSAYRIALDQYIQGHPAYTSAGYQRVVHYFEPSISSSFNRGYTPYFTVGRNLSMLSPLTPKSIGEYMGKVHQVFPDGKISFRTDSKTGSDLSNGDGLIFLSEDAFLGGTRLNSISENQLVLNDQIALHPGDRIYRNYHHQFQKRLMAGDTAVRRIPVCMRVTETNEDSLRIVFQDDEENGAELLIPIQERGDMPKNPDLALARFEQAFSKLSESPFVLAQSEIQPDVIRMTAQSVVNEWRRRLVKELLVARIAGRVRAKEEREKELIKKRSLIKLPPVRSYAFITQDYRDNIANQKALDFYKSLTDQHPGEAFELTFRNLQTEKMKTEVPVMTCKFCLRFELGMCPIHSKGMSSPKTEELHFDRALWKEPLYLRSHKHLFRLSFDCKACEMQIFMEK